MLRQGIYNFNYKKGGIPEGELLIWGVFGASPGSKRNCGDFFANCSIMFLDSIGTRPEEWHWLQHFLLICCNFTAELRLAKEVSYIYGNTIIEV